MKRLGAVLFSLGLGAFCLLGFSSAQILANGTEVLLTDLESQVIVGHGKVESGKLRLALANSTGGFFLYIVSPDGSVATHHGAVEADGLIGVFADDGKLLDLVAVLASRGVTLELDRLNENSVTPAPAADDAMLTSPNN